MQDSFRSGPSRRPLFGSTEENRSSSSLFRFPQLGGGSDGETEAFVGCLYARLESRVMGQVDPKINAVNEELGNFS